MPDVFTILIVDDEKNTLDGLAWGLEGEHRRILTAENGQKGLDLVRSETVDLTITDLKMPGMGGEELFAAIREESPETETIILTGHGSVQNAVEMMKRGAFEYLLKPVNLDELNALIDKIMETRDLRSENAHLRHELEQAHGFDNIIGKSEKMQEVYSRVRQVAPTRATVLLTGESGTGKEKIANAIHYNSNRRNRSFVRLNCGALTPTLLESELFGHEAGAFTDARARKIGRFEQADKGTLFLDEITETSPEFQVKLLRVLQEQEFERVGGTKTIRVDVRIITATNQDIDHAVREGRFREDLYYRLNVVKIELPPLRERPEDIPLLVQAFLDEFCELNERKPMTIAPKAVAALRNYRWPGNVRQLRNVIEGMVVMTSGRQIGTRNLPEEIRNAVGPRKTVSIPVGMSLSEVEKEMILATLERTEGNRAAAARMLGVGRKTLYRKLEEYGIKD